MSSARPIAMEGALLILGAVATLACWIVVPIELLIVAMLGDLATPATWLLLVLGAVVPAIAASWLFYRAARGPGASPAMLAAPCGALAVTLASLVALNR